MLCALDAGGEKGDVVYGCVVRAVGGGGGKLLKGGGTRSPGHRQPPRSMVGSGEWEGCGSRSAVQGERKQEKRKVRGGRVDITREERSLSKDDPIPSIQRQVVFPDPSPFVSIPPQVAPRPLPTLLTASFHFHPIPPSPTNIPYRVTSSYVSTAPSSSSPLLPSSFVLCSSSQCGTPRPNRDVTHDDDDDDTAPHRTRHTPLPCARRPLHLYFSFGFCMSFSHFSAPPFEFSPPLLFLLSASPLTAVHALHSTAARHAHRDTQSGGDGPLRSVCRPCLSLLPVRSIRSTCHLCLCALRSRSSSSLAVGATSWGLIVLIWGSQSRVKLCNIALRSCPRQPRVRADD